jgi:hypothetical protein
MLTFNELIPIHEIKISPLRPQWHSLKENSHSLSESTEKFKNF